MSMEISAEVLALWDKGQKIEAIKLLREQNGLGLKESKELLEACDEAQVSADMDVGTAPQTQAESMQQLRDQLEKIGMKNAGALLDAIGQGGKSGTTTLKTTTTTINGRTVTSTTASGDPEVAAQLLISRTGMAPDAARAQIDEAMARGSKIEAIQLLRAATGLGLAEAKDQIDAAMNGESLDWHNLPGPSAKAAAPPFDPSSISPGEVPRSHGWFWGLLLLAALTVGVWFYIKSP